MIIERTKGLVLCPSTALYEPFLNHCILTTIWRALSKPPQRRQGPDLCPLWLLVGTPSVIIPELAFSRAEHSRPYSDVAKYIFDIYYLLTMLFVHWFLWPLRLVWLLVCCLYKEVYLQIFKRVSYWLHVCCGEWEGWPVNRVNHTSLVAVVTPTDRPKSVRNCYLIELFCGVVCVATLPFWLFCLCKGFCHRTGSDLLFFVLKSVLSHMKALQNTVAVPLLQVIKPFNGVSSECKQFVRDIERYAQLAQLAKLGDADIPSIIHISCTGTAADFVQRFMVEYQTVGANPSCKDLKKLMTKWFGEIGTVHLIFRGGGG